MDNYRIHIIIVLSEHLGLAKDLQSTKDLDLSREDVILYFNLGFFWFYFKLSLTKYEFFR